MVEEIDISDIETALRTEDSPVQLAAFLTRLAAINSFRTEQLKKILLIKPKLWLAIQNEIPSALPVTPRPKPLSDKKTEMLWSTTEDGQKETALIYELKRIDILYRSISKRLSALETDYRMSKSL